MYRFNYFVSLRTYQITKESTKQLENMYLMLMKEYRCNGFRLNQLIRALIGPTEHRLFSSL